MRSVILPYHIYLFVSANFELNLQGGSVGKKTAIFPKIDFDILFYIDENQYLIKQNPPTYNYDSLINHVRNALNAEFSLEKLECTPNRFTWCVYLSANHISSVSSL